MPSEWWVLPLRVRGHVHVTVRPLLLLPLRLLLPLLSAAAGQSVPRAQNVLGVTFSYQPPPKSIVPCAASLKELYAPPNSVAK
jgi:hypothetical protein